MQTQRSPERKGKQTEKAGGKTDVEQNLTHIHTQSHIHAGIHKANVRKYSLLHKMHEESEEREETHVPSKGMTDVMHGRTSI